MTKKNFTSIIFVLDKSSSMTTKREQTLISFDEFVKEQREQDGECTMTLVQFDTEYVVKFVNKPIEDVKALEDIGYAPSGMTALIDATIRAIKESGEGFAKMAENERPDNVVLVQLTDGEENNSKAEPEDLQKLIDHQVEKYNWKIVYLHQGPEAFQQAKRLGMKAAHSNYFVGEVKAKGGLGMKRAMAAASYAVSSTRSSADSGMDKGGTESLLNDDSSDLDKYRSKQMSSSSTGGDA